MVATMKAISNAFASYKHFFFEMTQGRTFGKKRIRFLQQCDNAYSHDPKNSQKLIVDSAETEGISNRATNGQNAPRQTRHPRRTLPSVSRRIDSPPCVSKSNHGPTLTNLRVYHVSVPMTPGKC